MSSDLAPIATQVQAADRPFPFDVDEPGGAPADEAFKPDDLAAGQLLDKGGDSADRGIVIIVERRGRRHCPPSPAEKASRRSVPVAAVGETPSRARSFFCAVCGFGRGSGRRVVSEGKDRA